VEIYGARRPWFCKGVLGLDGALQISQVVSRIEGANLLVIEGSIASASSTTLADSSPAFGQQQLCLWCRAPESLEGGEGVASLPLILGPSGWSGMLVVHVQFGSVVSGVARHKSHGVSACKLLEGRGKRGRAGGRGKGKRRGRGRRRERNNRMDTKATGRREWATVGFYTVVAGRVP
jgi:hypothetical protein